MSLHYWLLNTPAIFSGCSRVWFKVCYLTKLCLGCCYWVLSSSVVLWRALVGIGVFYTSCVPAHLLCQCCAKWPIEGFIAVCLDQTCIMWTMLAHSSFVGGNVHVKSVLCGVPYRKTGCCPVRMMHLPRHAYVARFAPELNGSDGSGPRSDMAC